MQKPQPHPRKENDNFFPATGDLKNRPFMAFYFSTRRVFVSTEPPASNL
jgi:hypothetical protein